MKKSQTALRTRCWPSRMLSRTAFTALVAIALCLSSSAKIRPSFWLERASWHATDVVMVVAEGTDGVFTVVDTLKGRLQPGDQVRVPELKPERNAALLSVYPEKMFYSDDDLNTRVPKQVVGTRMVLFLRREPAQNASTTVQHWIPPSDWDDLKSSAVWIDGQKTYCFVQVMNPGPSALINCGMDETKLKAKVVEVVNVQLELEDAARLQDATVRAQALRRYIASDLRRERADRLSDAREFALEQLGKGGPSSLPVIRDMLDSSEFLRVGSQLVKALVEVDGASLGQELTERLQGELRFWQSAGPGLGRDWWNDDMTEDSPLRNRYMQTFEIIRGLQQTRFAGAIATVTQFRDYWRSLPQLNHPGLDELANECDKFIRGFRVE